MQPYAFEAREFLRQKLVGKEVIFVKESQTANSTDRGTLYLGKDMATAENVNEALIAAGLAEVRRVGKAGAEELRLVGVEEAARAAKVGKWAADAEASHVREVKYAVEDAKAFVDKHGQRPIEGELCLAGFGRCWQLLLASFSVYL